MNRNLAPLILLFVILTMSCGTVTRLTPPPAENDIGTLVAVTLTAHALPADGSGTTPGPAPDSLRVVYIREGNLWLWTQGMGSQQLTTSGDVTEPRFSDDGRMIAFQRAGNLWVIQSDGTGERLLVSAEYLAALANSGEETRFSWVDFAPRSHWLYFNTSLISLESGLGGPRLDLHRVDADNPVPVQLFPQNQGGVPYFSPDGQWIALSQAGQIIVSRPDGSGAHVAFTFPPISTYSEWFYLPEVVWMNTSGGFYVITPAPAILENPNEPARWWYVPLDGKAAQLAAFITAPVWVSFPRLAPDGTRAVYVRDPAPGLLELHLIDASTADMLLVSYAGQALGAGPWSPDGKYFTFWQDDPRKIFYAAPGETPQPIGDVAQTDFVTWVDGDTLLFKNDAELRLRRLSEPSLLIDGQVADNQFDFALFATP